MWLLVFSWNTFEIFLPMRKVYPSDISRKQFARIERFAVKSEKKDPAAKSELSLLEQALKKSGWRGLYQTWCGRYTAPF